MVHQLLNLTLTAFSADVILVTAVPLCFKVIQVAWGCPPEQYLKDQIVLVIDVYDFNGKACQKLMPSRPLTNQLSLPVKVTNVPMTGGRCGL